MYDHSLMMYVWSREHVISLRGVIILNFNDLCDPSDNLVSNKWNYMNTYTGYILPKCGTAHEVLS